MPDSCAYGLVHEGRCLDADPRELAVSGWAISEEYIHDEQEGHGYLERCRHGSWTTQIALRR